MEGDGYQTAMLPKANLKRIILVSTGSLLSACEARYTSEKSWVRASCHWDWGPKQCGKLYRRTCNILHQIEKARESCLIAWEQIELKQKIEAEQRRLAEKQAERDAARFNQNAGVQAALPTDRYQRFQDQAALGTSSRDLTGILARQFGWVKSPPTAAGTLSNQITDVGLRYLSAVNTQASSELEGALNSFFAGGNYSASNPRPSRSSRAYAIDNFLRVMSFDTNPSQPMPLGEQSAVTGSFSGMLAALIIAKNDGQIDEPLAQALFATAAIEGILNVARRTGEVQREPQPVQTSSAIFERLETERRQVIASAQPRKPVGNNGSVAQRPSSGNANQCLRRKNSSLTENGCNRSIVCDTFMLGQYEKVTLGAGRGLIHSDDATFNCNF